MVDFSVAEHDDVIIISISGEFYLESVSYAEELWNEQVSRQPRVIAFNCKKIKYIDSSAIGILVKFLNSSAKVNVKLVFFDLSETVVTVFKTAKLNNFFTTMSKEEFEAEYITH